jgi:hypothetical protein
MQEPPAAIFWLGWPECIPFLPCVALQEIEVPDAADAAAHKDASDKIRKYRITR